MNLETAAALLRAQGIPVDPGRIPIDDPEAIGLIARADTAGIARFDHEDALGLLRRLAPDRFGHLVAFQAINRMAPIASGLTERYVERRHGREAAMCEITVLDPLLGMTYGLLLFEEQTARIAERAAGWPPPEAAAFASAFGRYREDLMPELGRRFVEDAAPRFGGSEAAGLLLDFVRRNAPFTLPERRLSAFAAEGSRLAWLKVRHRAAFERARLESERRAAPVPA